MSEAATKSAASGVHPLDKVVWNALTGKQSRFALGDDRAVRYVDAVGRFAAVADYSPESFAALRPLVGASAAIALVTPDEVPAPAGLSVVRRATLLQMIWQGKPERPGELQYVDLGENDVPEMLALTELTEPGPFGPRTVELGRYLGVRNEGKLAAMAGERMQFEGFTEISAVCVDPAFRGRGYAAKLMKHLISDINARGETPFLHVFATNHAAIALYRALGFVDRRVMHLTLLGSA